MSYSWKEETKLMTCTSLLLRALEECGVLDANQSSIVTRISQAKAVVDGLESGIEKINALKELTALHEEVNAEATIPQTIHMSSLNFSLRYHKGRFVAEGDEDDEWRGRRDHEDFLEFRPKLEEKYSELERALLGDHDRIIKELQREIDVENVRQLTATVRAEREEAVRAEIALHQEERQNYLDSIERRKRHIEEEIMKKSKEMGFKVNKKKLGKKVQYVMVRRR